MARQDVTIASKNGGVVTCYSYIRFSTSEQLKGDSLRRQLEKSERYAKERGWILDSSLKMYDLGLSAFHGEHVDRGELGQFLSLVKANKIASGSVLLVESLDRLSRASVWEALGQFTNIINQGIRIITIDDGMEYSQETIEKNWTTLFVSLSIMARANEESLQKSRRLKAVWENKRKTKGILTSRCVAWLRISEDKTKFEEIKDRCKVVKLIFDLALKGYGKRRIEQYLNEKKFKAFVGKKGWHASYIHKILHNRAVLGEFQAFRREKRKRIAEGDVIKNYFPRIIEDKTFYQVQERLIARRQKGGRTGEFRNLFTGLVKCTYCGSAMQFVNKGKGKKGGTYLYCDSTRRGRGCKSKLFKYSDFEKAFLIYCCDLDASCLVDSNQQTRDAQMQAIKAEIESTDGKLRIVRKRVDNFTSAIGEQDDERVKNDLKRKAAQGYDEIEGIEANKLNLQRELERIAHCQIDAANHIRSIDDLMKAMNSASGADLAEMRARLRIQLQQIIRQIDVSSAGRYTTEKKLKELDVEIAENMRKGAKSKKHREEAEFLKRMRKFEEEHTFEKLTVEQAKAGRSFTIHFTSGKCVIVFLRNADFSGIVFDGSGTEKERFTRLNRKMRQAHSKAFIDARYEDEMRDELLDEIESL